MRRPCLRDWARHGAHPRSCYVIGKHRASPVKVYFLDVVVYRSSDKHGRKGAPFPCFKPTSLEVPLRSESSHTMTLHSSWPRAYAARLTCNSSNLLALRQARDVFCVDSRKSTQIGKSLATWRSGERLELAPDRRLPRCKQRRMLCGLYSRRTRC